MDREIKTSFIPKQPAVKSRPATKREGGGLFFVGSIFLLVVAGLFYGGIFGYQSILASQINRSCPSDDPRNIDGCGLKESIEKVSNSIDQNLLVRFKRVDAKLNAADMLVGRHVTINGFLNDLSGNVLHTIRFTNFEFKGDEILMAGVAEGYDDIALQSDVFAEDRGVLGFIFSDLNLDDEGKVVFNLSLSLDPETTSYDSYLNTNSLENI